MPVKTKKHLKTKHNKRNKYNKKKTRKNRKIGGKPMAAKFKNWESRYDVNKLIDFFTQEFNKGKTLKKHNEKDLNAIFDVDPKNSIIDVPKIVLAFGSKTYDKIEKFIKLLQKHKYEFPTRDTLLKGIHTMIISNTPNRLNYIDFYQMSDEEMKYKIRFAELLLEIKPERHISFEHDVTERIYCDSHFKFCNLLSAYSSKNNNLELLKSTNNVGWNTLFDPEKDKGIFADVMRIKKEKLLEKNPNFLGVKDSKNNLELALQGQIDNLTKDYSEVLEFILRSAKNADISQKLYVPSVVKLLTDNIEIFKKYPEVVKRLLDDANRLNLKSLLELLEEKAEPEKEDIDTDQ
jgi:hypothetical protein